MPKRMLIDAVHPEETRVVIENNGRIEEFDFVTSAKKQIKGNIYLAKITRVEPSLQAAFVEYGGGKQGFLPFSEIHPDYYQIPVSDRQRLMEEQEALEQNTNDDDIPLDADPLDLPPSEPLDLSESEPFDSTPPTDLNEAPITEPYRSDLPASFESASAIEPEQPPADYTGETGEATDSSSSGDQQEASEVEVPPATPGVETLGNEEEMARKGRGTSVFTRRYRIQEVIKRGQVLLVQVIKEERGNKGVSLTTFISLAGRYCVLMPNSPKDGGVSRRISSAEDRRRLKELLTEMKLAGGMSAIIRTAGTDRTRAEIKRDFDYLVRLWDTIREITLTSTAPALVYEEGDLIKRSLRDLYNNDIEDIIVEGEEAFNQAKEFMKMLMPSHAPRVKPYTDATPLFYSVGIEDQLATMYDPVVKLKSGGYIVISPTEALISIDVNSGRSTGERNIEETASKTNIEAAWEIARQVRLRDLAGLLVIDFIDMLSVGNRKAVERNLRDALRQDRAKIQLGRISPFGLLEMSRQRLRPSLSETAMMTCPHCEGRGTVRSHASVSIQLLRSLEKDASTGQFGELRLSVMRDAAIYLLNQKRDLITQLEKEYQTRITVSVDDDLTAGDFRVERIKLSQGERNQRKRPMEEAKPVASMNSVAPSEETFAESPEDSEPMFSNDMPAERNEPEVVGRPDDYGRPRGGRGRGRRGGQQRRPYEGRNPRGPRDNNAPNPNGEPSASGEPAMADAAPAANGEQAPRGNGQRGRGRRRRWNNDGPRDGRNQNRGENNSASPSDASSGSGSRPYNDNRAPRDNTSSVVSMTSSASESGESKPAKKGWWRRIVES